MKNEEKTNKQSWVWDQNQVKQQTLQWNKVDEGLWQNWDNVEPLEWWWQDSNPLFYPYFYSLPLVYVNEQG